MNLNDLSLTAGNFLGGKSRELQAAAGVATAAQLGVIRSKATHFLERVGENMGRIVGSGPISIVARAAEPSSRAATENLERRHLMGFTENQILAGAAGVAVLLFLMNKRSLKR